MIAYAVEARVSKFLSQPRAEFLLALGTLSLAACSGGGGPTLAPNPKSNGSGVPANPGTLSVKRTGANTVRATVDGKTLYDMTANATGLSLTIGTLTRTVSYKSVERIQRGGAFVGDASGPRVRETSATRFDAISTEGKAASFETDSFGHTNVSLEGIGSIFLTANFLKPQEKLAKVSSLELPFESTHGRTAQDYLCTQTWYYVDHGDGSGKGTLTTSCYDTGGGTGGGSQPGGGGGAPTPSDCVLQLLIATGIGLTTTVLDAGFGVALAAALAGIALTGVGALAVAIAIIAGLLLTLAGLVLDHLVLENLVLPCYPGAS